MKDQKLKEALQKRRVQMGVRSNIKGVKQDLTAIVVPEQSGRQIKNPLEDQITLVDLSEEEDRDREMLNQLMKKYAKIWKFMFQRYANQAYSSKGKKDFDDMGRKVCQINLAEITKMLKEHNTYPLLIKKDEIACIIRLINHASNSTNSSEIAMLDYNQFLQFVPQLSFLCFSRPPIDKSHMPYVESIKAMLNQWEQATKERGKSTQLYEDPDLSMFSDRELIKAIEKKIDTDPTYPVPEGYRKTVEKSPIYKYHIPECAREVMKPSNVVVIECLDTIFDQILGIHFLEPQVTFESKTKIKAIISKQMQPEKAEALNYMKKVEKKTDLDLYTGVKKGTANAYRSAADKRQDNLEVRPKINLALKL